MKSQRTCDVLIVAHNSGALLTDALESAVVQAGVEHVCVIDADSTDDGVTTARDSFPGVRVIPVPNRGFAAACNRGIEATASPYVLLLNPDAELQPGALEALQTTIRDHPRAGIVGALVLNTDGSVQAGSYGRFPSLAATVRLHLWRAWQRLRGNDSLSPPRPASTGKVDWVTGAALLARRATLEEVGLLDEGFFLYYEDVDWCRRMRSAGWEVLLEPAAQVVHHLGASGGRRGAAARAYRESFYRYCDVHGLWGLKLVGRWALLLRRPSGGKT